MITLHYSITTSHCVTCLGVDIDAEAELRSQLAHCFHQLRQLWCIRAALSAENASMLVHALSASRLDYCNSILYQAAAVHLRPKCCSAPRRQKAEMGQDHINSLRDDLRWLLFHQ